MKFCSAKLHPATQILTWCLMASTIQVLEFSVLLRVVGLILLCAFLISGNKFAQLLRRTRWIILSLLLVYAYSTPGQSLFVSLGMFSPTREGLTGGVLQLTRLLAVLAGLAILLDRLTRQQLIAGLYALFTPLQWVGLSRERLAVRLALTLHYAEAAMVRKTNTWQEILRSLDPEGRGQRTEESRHIELQSCCFSIADALLLSSVLLVLLVAMR
ncbi:MAG: CbiQ family ECF transporter T component [Gallionella sp.]